MVFGAIVNGIDSWFLFHRWCMEMQPISVGWFYILQLCWIHESVLAVFWWNLLGFPYTVSCHLRRVKVWPPPGRFGCLFISLCCLIAEVKTSNTMLNNSDESGHPCLVPDLRGKALSFSPLKILANRIQQYIKKVFTTTKWDLYLGCRAGSISTKQLTWFITSIKERTRTIWSSQ